MRAAVVKVRGQRAANRIAAAIGKFGGMNPRGAGAEEHADPAGAVPFACLQHGLLESVLPEPELCQAIVAAVEFREVRTHRQQFAIRYLTDAGFELHRLESARGQAGAARAQRINGRVDTDCDAADDCSAAEYERMQIEGSCSSRSVRSLNVAHSRNCERGYVPGQGASMPGSGMLCGFRRAACGYNPGSRKEQSSDRSVYKEWKPRTA